MYRDEWHRRESDRLFDAVQARVGACVLERCRIDVDRDYVAVALADQCCCDGQDAGASAGVEDRAWPMRGDDRFESAKSAGGRGMVAGAESLCRLDYDCGAAGFVLASPWRHD